MNISKLDSYFKTLQKQLGCESFTYTVSEGFKVKLRPLSNKDDSLVIVQLRQQAQSLPQEDRTELAYSYIFMNLILSKAIIGLYQNEEYLDLSGEFLELETSTEEGVPLKTLKEESIQNILDTLPSAITQAIYAFYMDCVSKYSATLDANVKSQVTDSQLEIDKLKARIEELEETIKQSAIELRQKHPLETVEEKPNPPQPVQAEEGEPVVDPSTLAYQALDLAKETPPSNSKKNPRFK